LRGGYLRTRTFAIWFVQYQGSLSHAALYVEFAFLASLMTLWMLRRHVRRRRYVERARAWYDVRRKRVLRKYLDLVERVARTSSIVAMLLPHLAYAIFVVGLRRAFPSALSYLATRTYLTSLVGLWHPMYTTIALLGRIVPVLGECDVDAAASASSAASAVASTTTPSTLKKRRLHMAEMEALRVEIIDMLEYWVVYAVLHAIVRTGRLLPFVGHVLDYYATISDVDTTTTIASSKGGGGLFGKISRTGGSYYARWLRPSGKFVEEATLVLFVWLRHMPSFVGGEDVREGISRALSPKGPIYPVEHSRFGNNNDGRPVSVLYRKLSPAVLATMNSSAFLMRGGGGGGGGGVRNKGESTLVSVAIQKFHSLLDVLVLVRMMSVESKDWLIMTIVESSALLPALTTLLMPSYFTKYGVIYVSLVVPAGYTIASCDAMRGGNAGRGGGRRDVEGIAMAKKIDDSSRYLKFWIVHAALSMILAYLAPVLSWMPLSTHATWLIWAYVQLRSSTRAIYGWFEGEFGKKSLSDTAVARSARWVMAALPSNVKDDGESKNEDTSKMGNEKSKDD
jgi:hypothetical protein